VYPREVEECLLEHPALAEVAVIGRPDAEWGESMVGYLVVRAGAPVPDAAALDAHCLERIARYKRPKAWRIVDALPKNAYGKVLKTDLRAAEAARGAD
jgi:long-chain acyl-CoA synthetase